MSDDHRASSSSDPQGPPDHIVSFAVDASGWSPCRSKRGVVIFSDGDVISLGHNYKPRGFDCDDSNECKATCRREAIHAEQQALMSAGNRAHASEMLHVKTVDGTLVPSGGPSCVECSKLALAAGIAWVWLYHDTGWRRYTGKEFHALSLRAAAASDDGARQPHVADSAERFEFDREATAVLSMALRMLRLSQILIDPIALALADTLQETFDRDLLRMKRQSRSSVSPTPEQDATK